MKDVLTIIDQYISPKVLPIEQVFGWIKWKSGINFDKIVLRYEADIDIQNLFNTGNELTEEIGKITIPKNMIQRDGFFGFASGYSAKLKNERNVSYEIDIVSGDRIQTVHLENTVTRPMIQVLEAKPDSIHLSKLSPQPQPLSISLKNSGTTPVRNLEYFIDIITDNKLKVDIRKKDRYDEILLSDDRSGGQSIQIDGEGHGMIRLGVTYYDDFNTEYNDILKEIPITVEHKQTQTIPITEQIEKPETHLLTIPK